MSQTEKLTKNQALVFDVLIKTGTPLSAYSILDALRDEGLRAPLQIYRALDALTAMGNVHRLESLNAFVACSHPSCSDHRNTAFIICENCKVVSELHDHSLDEKLKTLAADRTFTLQKSIVELRGLCSDCQSTH